jgi:muconate cycloisomerase
VGSAAMIHLAMAAPGIQPDEYPCDIIGPFYYEDDIVKEPQPIAAGQACLNGKPGLGVELDDDKIAKYKV